MSTAPDALLSVTGLGLELHGARLLAGVDLAVGPGEVVGLVGESGSGKTLTGLSILGLTPPGARLAGSIRYGGSELVGAAPGVARALRGRQISMIFQEPRPSLNPALPIGRQITDVMQAHLEISRRAAAAATLGLLGQVGLPDPRGCFASYPHELSGGMCQRAMIAMALSCGPRLLIADEPTTALDVTVQAQIVSLLRSIADEQQLSILLITHNLAVVTEICDRVVTMYCGQVVDAGTTHQVVTAPAHPYTWALMAAAQPRLPGEPGRAGGGAGGPAGQPRRSSGRLPVPSALPVRRAVLRRNGARPGHHLRHRPDALPAALRAVPPRRGRMTPPTPPVPAPAPAPVSGDAAARPPAVAVRGLTVRHESRTPAVVAVDNVTLDVEAGETLAVIGESGSGKSTLLKTIAGLHSPSAGTVTISTGPGGPRPGAPGASGRADGPAARQTRTGRPQVVFQDPDLALNPRQPVWKIIAEPAAPGRLRLPASLRAEVEPLLAEVGLSAALADRKPHELSGGQRQRVTIARALASQARLVLFDEPVSAQDVSLQASLLRLLARLQQQRGLTYLIVSHDVAAVAATADRVGVMYAAKLVEIGDTAAVLSHPRHPYTQALIAAVPRIVADPAARRPAGLHGEPPDLRRPPGGCRFRMRCPFAAGRCASEEPQLRDADGHQVACHRWEEIAAGTASPRQGR